MAEYRFLSTEINVYPLNNRGKNSDNKYFDPESIKLDENVITRVYRNITSGNYVLSFNSTRLNTLRTETLSTNNTIECIMNGYYVKFNLPKSFFDSVPSNNYIYLYYELTNRNVNYNADDTSNTDYKDETLKPLTSNNSLDVYNNNVYNFDGIKLVSSSAIQTGSGYCLIGIKQTSTTIKLNNYMYINGGNVSIGEESVKTYLDTAFTTDKQVKKVKLTSPIKIFGVSTDLSGDVGSSSNYKSLSYVNSINNKVYFNDINYDLKTGTINATGDVDIEGALSVYDTIYLGTNTIFKGEQSALGASKTYITNTEANGEIFLEAYNSITLDAPDTNANGNMQVQGKLNISNDFMVSNALSGTYSLKVSKLTAIPTVTQTDATVVTDNVSILNNARIKNIIVPSSGQIEFGVTSNPPSRCYVFNTGNKVYLQEQYGSEGGAEGVIVKDIVSIPHTTSNKNISSSSTLGAGNVNIDGSLFVNDTSKFNGRLYASAFDTTSDKRLKKNIKSYSNNKSLLDLDVKKFDYKEGLSNQIGCLAQDLQKICPEIVTVDEEGYLSIQESKIVYLLLNEVKKLNDRVNQLEGK